MNLKDVIKNFGMRPHEENGCYSECHYPYTGEDRAASGSSYFFVNPGEATQFHRIDCDEYWCFHAGSSLEVWIINLDGQLSIEALGLEDGCDPVIYFPKGVIFASRNLDSLGEGTFFSCITVPRFDYEGFELIEKEKVLEICPQVKDFYF